MLPLQPPCQHAVLVTAQSAESRSVAYSTRTRYVVAGTTSWYRTKLVVVLIYSVMTMMQRAHWKAQHEARKRLVYEG